MVLGALPRLTGDERKAKWAGIYAATRSLLWTPGDTAYLQVPMADQAHDTGLVVTTIGTEQVAGTYSAGLSVFDWAAPPSYLDPLGCPVINFDGVGNWVEFVDAPFWNDTAGSNESSYCWAMWVFVIPSSNFYVLFNKSNAVGTSGKDWMTLIGSDEKLVVRIWDDSANAYIGQVSNNALSDGWHHIAVTKADDNAGGTTDAMSNDVILYDNGAVLASTISKVDTYVTQEGGTNVVRFGAETDGASPNGLSIAGAFAGPIFRAVGANAVWSPDTVKRLFQLQGAALGIL